MPSPSLSSEENDVSCTVEMRPSYTEVMTTVPGPTAVTTPSALTVATDVLLEK